MSNEKDYGWIFKQYPVAVKKEQFYQICHISKRTALVLLETGLVPCLNSGRKTRQYTILTKDVVAYLIDREHNPEKYRLPVGSYCKNRGHWQPRPERTISTALLGDHAESFYQALLEPYPDVLSVFQVAEGTGYDNKRVNQWCHSGKLRYFNISGRFQIPKISLLEFMLSGQFKGIRYKTEQHKLELLSILTRA